MFDFNSVNESFYTQEQIAKLTSSSICICGAGGLGSNSAFILVRAGIQKLTLVDFDIISESNFNRQYYRVDQLNEVKVETLRKNLLEINPNLQLTVHNARVTKDNIDEIIGDADIVVEAFDTPESKAMLSQKMFADPRPFVCVSGIAGYGNSDRIITRELRNNNWVVGDGTSGVDKAPPLAPSVLIAAGKQADVVLTAVLNG